MNAELVNATVMNFWSVGAILAVLAALTLLAAFWLIGAIAMIPWYFRGVEGRGRSLEALVR